MDYVIGQHEQLPVFFKTDTYFSKYLKVCEHYCTTTPFYNWCDHKPYSYLDVGAGLPFAQYFVDLFNAEGDYARLGLEFDQTLLENILKGRTSMVEAITRLYTDGCSFFKKFNDPSEVDKKQEEEDKKQEEEDTLCEKASGEDEVCIKPTPQPSFLVQDTRSIKRKEPKKQKPLVAKRPSANSGADDNSTADTMHEENDGGSTSRQRQTFKRRQQGGNRTFKRHPRDKHKRKHNDDGLTKHKTSNKLRRKKSVKN